MTPPETTDAGATGAPSSEAAAPAKASAKPKERSFEIKETSKATRVDFGADPRVSVSEGETFKTDDEQLANLAAAQPELKETT